MRTFSIFAVLLLLAGCNDSQAPKKQSQVSSVTVASSAVSAPLPEPAAEVASEPASEAAPAAASEAAAEPVVQEADAVVSSEDINVAATSAPMLTHKPETSPAILYQKCAACHGNHAEKSALNQSAVIGGWDSARIAAAIVGYQEGTYGGAMKVLMQNQVKDLSRVQIDALSEYIANLYVKTH